MPSNKNSIWVPARIERLKALWKNGASGSEIASELGVTRSAVLGKIFRLGMCEPKTAVSTKRKRAVEKSWDKRPRAKLRKLIPIQQEEPTIIDTGRRNIALVDLEHGDCRYPDGDGPFTFCGHPRFEGSSYCRAHLVLSLAKPRTNADAVTNARRERMRRLNYRKSLLEAAE